MAERKDEERYRPLEYRGAEPLKERVGQFVDWQKRVHSSGWDAIGPSALKGANAGNVVRDMVRGGPEKPRPTTTSVATTPTATAPVVGVNDPWRQMAQRFLPNDTRMGQVQFQPSPARYGQDIMQPARGGGYDPAPPPSGVMRPAPDQFRDMTDLQRYSAYGRNPQKNAVNITADDVNRLASQGNYDLVAEAGKPIFMRTSGDAFSNRIQSFIDQQNAITAEARARDEANRPPAIVGDTEEQTRQILLDKERQKAAAMAWVRSMDSGPGSWERGAPYRQQMSKIADMEAQRAESAKSAAEIARERIASEGVIAAEDIKAQGALAKQAMADRGGLEKARMEKDYDRNTEKLKQQGDILGSMLEQGNISLPELVPDWDNMNAFGRRNALTGLLKTLFADDSAPDPDEFS